MNQEIELTLLVDNTVMDKLTAEHGFAAWISSPKTKILFDTGAGTALPDNAQKLGIDLEQAQALVLSHGHYDHTGGLAGFLGMNRKAEVYCGQAVAISRYSCHPDVPPRAIGISPDNYRALLDLPPQRTHELHAPHYLQAGIGITGPIPRRCAFEDTGGPFFLDANKKQPDLIGDDQAIWLETQRGLVIIVGCCHAGLINTVEYIRKISGITRIHGIIGGLHLQKASSTRLEKTLQALLGWKLDFLVPSHCTGDAATEYLQRAMGSDVVKSARAGMRIKLGQLRKH